MFSGYLESIVRPSTRLIDGRRSTLPAVSALKKSDSFDPQVPRCTASGRTALTEGAARARLVAVGQLCASRARGALSCRLSIQTHATDVRSLVRARRRTHADFTTCTPGARVYSARRGLEIGLNPSIRAGGANGTVRGLHTRARGGAPVPASWRTRGLSSGITMSVQRHRGPRSGHPNPPTDKSRGGASVSEKAAMRSMRDMAVARCRPPWAASHVSSRARSDGEEVGDYRSPSAEQRARARSCSTSEGRNYVPTGLAHSGRASECNRGRADTRWSLVTGSGAS